jgi:hypothetical protein
MCGSARLFWLRSSRPPMPIEPGEYVKISTADRRLGWERVEGEPDGVTEALLHRHESDGSYTHLLRIEAGVELPGPVTHEFYEEAYYLEGEVLNVGTGESIGAGSYVFHEPGEEHGPYRCLETCLILEFRYYK